MRSFDLHQSQSESELALFEKLEQSMTASSRRLNSPATSRTMHAQATCAWAQTSIAAMGAYHDRDHRRTLQPFFSSKLPRADRHHLELR